VNSCDDIRRPLAISSTELHRDKMRPTAVAEPREARAVTFVNLRMVLRS